MKLNVKHTVLVGLAFMAISAFWQLYDFSVPLILKETYDMGDTASGVVMAMDNIVALFMLPIFGALSDRCTAKMGRRMPFMLAGGLGSAVLMALLPQAAKGAGVAAFLTLLAVLLLIMSTFRSPAVALMPDVTPKPLRSRGNAVINLMGAIGGAVILLLTNFLLREFTLPDGRTVGDYTLLYVAAALIMAVSMVVVWRVIPERRLAEEAERLNRTLEAAEPALEDNHPVRTLSRSEKASLVLLLCSVALWFMGYNAVTTAFSKYAKIVWQLETDAAAANCILVGMVGAIVSYWPVGQLSSRFGRKRVILAGVALMALCFLVGALMPRMSFVAYVIFALVGLGWAAINVNSYPMVVQLASGADVGRYTGFYYTFSMAAQVLTPVLSGALLEHVSYRTLFPYAFGMMAAAFLTMSLVKHGDSKPLAKSGLEALDVED